MFELRLLGSLDLRGSEGEEILSVLSQPKRVALLAYLAVAKPRGFHRRDKLVSLFWPDLDQDRARAALRKSLHHLRRSLGEEAVLSRGDEEVSLGPEFFRLDVALFVEAAEAGRPEEALELYRGPLLEGFHVAGCEEFERWLDRERQGLREVAARAAWELSHRYVSAGLLADGERMGRRALDLAPTDEVEIRRFVEGLAEAGARAAAVAFFERFAGRLEEELGILPDAESRDLAARIRDSRVARASSEGEVGGPAVGEEMAAVNNRDLTEIPAYRFETTGEAAATPALATTPARAKRLPFSKVGAIVAGVVGVIIIGTVATSNSRSDVPEDRRPSIAVLPFQNFGTDSAYAFLASGMQGQIHSKLSGISALRIVSPSSVMKYQESRPNSRQIADELGASRLVEGSVQVSGSQVHLTVQLIDARRDEVLWGEEYDRELTAENLFEVQGEIARQVAHAIGVILTPEERDRVARILTDDTEAYLLYLQGIEEYIGERQMGTVLSDFESSRLFDQSIELDPNFAPAHAYLALSLAHTNREYQFERAGHEAEFALSIMPRLGEARVALGLYRIRAGESQEAMRQFQAAEEENPNMSLAIFQLGLLQQRLGDFQGGLNTLERAERLDPFNPIILSELPRSYRFAHRFDDALEAARKWEDTYPSYSAIVVRAVLHVVRGELEEARAGIADAMAVGSWRPYQGIPGTFWSVFRRMLTDEDRRVAFEEYRKANPEYFESPCTGLVFACLRKAIHEEEVGSKERARIYWDSLALVAQESPRRNRNQNFGVALIHQGRGEKEAAIRAAEIQVSRGGATSEGEVGDSIAASHDRIFLARILAHFDEHDRAMDILEEELPAPSQLSVHLLELDPIWDPLRGHPRFQALLEASADDVAH